MPLLPGKSNIGHNVKEMEKSGHSKAQSVAAALHTAYDEPYAKPTTAMTLADINKLNESYHGNMGEAPNQAAAPELAGTRVAAVPVYRGHMGDEVKPTQSDPPDERSDNLLERAGGGLPGTESPNSGIEVVSGDGVLSAAKAGARVGEKVAEGEVVDAEPKANERRVQHNLKHFGEPAPMKGAKPLKSQDDLVEGSEAMSVEEHQ